MSRYDRRLKGLGINGGSCSAEKPQIKNPFNYLQRRNIQRDAAINVQKIQTPINNQKIQTPINNQKIQTSINNQKIQNPINKDEVPSMLAIITKHDKLLQKLLLRFNDFEEKCQKQFIESNIDKIIDEKLKVFEEKMTLWRSTIDNKMEDNITAIEEELKVLEKETKKEAKIEGNDEVEKNQLIKREINIEMKSIKNDIEDGLISNIINKNKIELQIKEKEKN